MSRIPSIAKDLFIHHLIYIIFYYIMSSLIKHYILTRQVIIQLLFSKSFQ
jgi:hypothetical protein